jgi:protein TonB
MATGKNSRIAGTRNRGPIPAFSGGWSASRVSAIPPLSALSISIIVHASAAAALVILAGPADPPVPEPEPMAIMVQFVSDPMTENEEEQEVQKGDPEEVETEEAAPEKNDIEEIEETAEAQTVVEQEQLPDNVPVPVQKPRPEPRKTEERAPDKSKVAAARGLEDDPRPDIVPGDQLQLANEADASFARETMRGVARNVDAEQKWLGRLAAHLERRKRYPHTALSKRREGLVQVRFVVASDGSIVSPELVGPSGVPELDEEALDLLRRASPAPKPPPDVNPFVTVPISFTVKR